MDADEHVARRLAQHVVSLYQRTKHSQHHRLTFDFLDDDKSTKPELAAQFALFLEGASMASLKFLETEVALLMYHLRCGATNRRSTCHTEENMGLT